MQLLLPVDWSHMRPAPGGRGLILAAAHIGPPKFAMHAILDGHDSPMILTNTEDMPGWLPELGGTLMHPGNPERRAEIMLRAAVRLRAGGVLFAAPDGGSATEAVTFKAYGRRWKLAAGLPALARMLGSPCCVALALWEGNRVVLRTYPIEAPDRALDRDAFHRDWAMKYWAVLASVIERSPENLRFLARKFRRELSP